MFWFFFFFFFPGFSGMFWAGLLSKSLDSFIFFVYFRLYERLETSIFFKFFWFVNRALEARFPGRKLLPHQTMEIKHLRLDLLAKIDPHKLEMLVNNIVW